MPTVGGGALQLTKRPATQAVRRRVAGGFARGSIYSAKAHFSEIVREVERTGVHVVICRNKTPVVEIVPLRTNSDPLIPDPALKGAVFAGDPSAPLPVDDWPETLR